MAASAAARRRARRAADKVERDLLAIEDATLRAIIADLERARLAMLDAIASAPKEWQIIHAKGVLAELDRQLSAWERTAGETLAGAVPRTADLGMREVTDALTAAGITLATAPVIPQTIVATAYQTLPDLISGVRTDTIAKVGSILRQAVLGGLSPADAMRLVGRIVGPTARGPFRNAALRSEFIVRTELGRIAQQASFATQADLAKYDANAGLMSEWVTAGDSRVRHDHAVADGQRVKVGGEFTIGGYKAKYPHDPRLPAKESIGCRCRILPHHPSWDEVEREVAAEKKAHRVADPEFSGTLKSAEERIDRLRTAEELVAIDPRTGEVVVSMRGGPRGFDVPAEVAEKLAGMVVTHNHPGGYKYPLGSPLRRGRSFSAHDVELAVAAQVREIRAISPGYVHVLRPGSASWSQEYWDKIVLPLFLQTLREVRVAFAQRVRTREMTFAQSKADREHEVWRRISVLLEWDYERTER